MDSGVPYVQTNQFDDFGIILDFLWSKVLNSMGNDQIHALKNGIDGQFWNLITGQRASRNMNKTLDNV